MKLIKEEKINREISDLFVYNFDLTENGLYLIEIIASAKSWRQNLKNFRSFFSDDDLAVKIDDLEFPKKSGKTWLFDAKMAWNGNQLCGLFKTGLFAVYFGRGKHTISFLNDIKPFVKNIKISKIEEGDKIIYIPTQNNPAENGNRRPWLSLILVNLAVSGLKIIAKADKQKNDDDDLKLIINGETQINNTAKAHKNWYWCGKILKGGEKKFAKELKLGSGWHYIELWADGEPFLERMEIQFIKPDENKNRTPTVNNPEWTGNFNDDPEQILLARAIFGEARSLPEQGKIAVGWSIKNRVIDAKRWGDNYHEVILQPKQYSSFNLDDKNLPYVRNPFLDKAQITDWHDCYKIAGQVMAGEVSDPTGGANHYYSEFIKPPYWTKDKNAEFTIKIGNTLFYNIKIKQNAPGGFSKFLFALIITVVLAADLFIFQQVKIEAEAREAEQNIQYRHYFINPKTEEINVLYLNEQGNIDELRQLTFDQYPKSHLEVFNDNELIGYFQNINKNGETNPAGKEAYYKNYVKLMIKPGENGTAYEVYRGDVHTSYWEWRDNKHVIVYYGCGTRCLYYYVININTKEVEDNGHAYE